MGKKLAVILVLASLVVGCKSKKAYADRLRTKNVLEARKDKKNVKEDVSTAELPKDNGKFIRFEIESIDAYIETFAELAQMEMKTYGIPASITLAQGLLESGYGKGELALKTNNHFGIKCHKGWQGDYDFHDDDEKGECFRKYNHPRYSFRDHSLFLTTRSRYEFLFDYRHDDYVNWAKGLKKAGYATDKKYPQKLIYLIEKYDLHIYDQGVAVQRRRTIPAVVANTDTYHIVEKGDTLYSLSKRYYLSVDDLMRINNLQDATLSIGQKLTVKK
jgi:flagellum-specific peptidoglycan hydrolase FlgJ